MGIIKKIKKQLRQVSNWRQFEQQIKPAHAFDESISPAKPDYTSLDHWAVHPHKNSKVQLVPEGMQATTAWKEGEVDCFFIHPTVCFDKFHWNASIDHIGINELVDEMIIPGQASAFNACCRMFAPRYRQATFFSFLRASNNSRQALSTAYADVVAAFDHYLTHFNKGRPFFLAGHSQGALHLMRLLEERIASTELRNQLVAAYPIGFLFPQDKFQRTLSSLHPSQHPSDTQCVIAWDTYLAAGRPIRILDRAEMCYATSTGLRWERRANKKVLGINPLSWTQDPDKVSKEKHLGGVHIILQSQQKINWENLTANEPLGLDCTGLSRPHPNQVAAQVGNNGVLFVSSPTNRMYKTVLLPGGSLHLFDISLFYMNLRANVVERWQAYEQYN